MLIGYKLQPAFSTVSIGLFAAALFFAASAGAKPPGISTEKGPLPSEEAFIPDLVQGSDGAYAVSWNIAQGYYLYRDKIKLSSEHALLSYQRPPPDEIIEDEFFGESGIYRYHLMVDFSVADGQQPAAVKAHYQGCWDKGLCYPPQVKTLYPNKTMTSAAALLDQGLMDNSYTHYLQEYPLALATLIFLGFGVLLAFTPCVLPMVPILAGIVAGGNAERRSAGRSFVLSSAYVFAMAAVYSLLGVAVGLSGANLYAWFQKPEIVVPFALVFALLAAGMFGWLHLGLPSGLHNKLSQTSGQIKQGNVGGAFLLGGLSALIVSPCITPALVGALLFIAGSGDAVMGASILFALALGMGLPLILFGTSLGRFLPKPGPAMVIINTLFGFLLLATAVWLLDRVIPSVWSMGLAVLTLVFIAARIYHQCCSLVGKTRWAIRFGTALPVAALSILFAASLATGGRQLIAPWSHWLSDEAQTSDRLFSFAKIKTNDALDKALAQSKAMGKPALVYFSAQWCTTCKELDAYVFSKPKVQTALHAYDLIKVDVTHDGSEENGLLKRFNLFGPPTLLFFDQHGREIKNRRLYGYVNAEQFISHLQENQMYEASMQAQQ